MTRNQPASTYDDDFFTWTQEQAAALRHLPPETTGIDIAHLAEEIEDLGKRDLREVGSFLARVAEHLLKLTLLPSSPDASHWRSETLHFADSAHAAFSPGMRHLLDVDVIWRRGRKRFVAVSPDIAGRAPIACPFTLDDLLSDDFDLDHALAVLDAATTG